MVGYLDELDVAPAWLHSRAGLKWRAAGAGVLAAWVADMDYPAPPAVREALARLATDGDLGYPAWLHEAVPLREEFARRMTRRYGWSPDPGQVREFTDIIQAVQVLVHLTTAPGDGVAIHVPAYPPFLESLAAMGRRIVPVPIERAAAGWATDPERLARAVTSANARVFILVNPQNPTGRSVTRPELEAIAEVAEARDLMVISDEVHADLTYPPHEHIPFATVSPQAAGRTVTLTSATKAFNLAGIRCAVAHIGPAPVRAAFAALPPLMFGTASVPGVTATLAAWRDCDAWLAAVLARLAGNREILRQALAGLGIGYDPPQATYLAWLDCRGLGLDGDPARFFLDSAKVMLSAGPLFTAHAGPPEGVDGAGFARLNFATSPAVLTEICDRMAAALAVR